MGLSGQTAASPAAPWLTRSVVLTVRVRSLLAAEPPECLAMARGCERRLQLSTPAQPPLLPPGILGMGEETARPRRAVAYGTRTLSFIRGLPPAPHTASTVGARHGQHQGLLRGPGVTVARGAPLEAGSKPGATRAWHQPPVTLFLPRTLIRGREVT